jgi:cobalt-zinc-cadmium efflux system outer membrane protein
MSTLQRCTLAAALAISVAAPLQAQPASGDATVFVPRASLDLAALMGLVARSSPVVSGELLAVDLARAEVRQSRLIGNPTIDGTWGTIPVGDTNPSGLGSPLGEVPYYSLGASYTFPIGKRGPRQARAAALEQSARAGATATARAIALELTRTLGDAAIATLRIDGLRGLVSQEKGSIELAQSRLSGGFGTPLEVDRLEIELGRTEQLLLANEAEMRDSLATCAATLGVPCEPFPSSDEARAYLDAWVSRAEAASGPIDERPDVRALVAAERAASAETDLAKAQALPDPTVRLGYTFDQFVVSGNQRHSLNLSLSLPLPIFDWGQAQRDAADARRTRLAAQRERVTTVARVRTTALRRALESHQKRREVIAKMMLPRARLVVADLEKAASTRLIPLTDVIQARRTLSELLVQEAESHGEAFRIAINLVAESSAGATDVHDRGTAPREAPP